MFGYIYKTTNLINNKIYIGQKRSDTFLEEKYLGSGHMLQKAVHKYGKDNFKVELLDYAETKNELDQLEIYYIDLYNSTNVNIGYNIAKGGQGGNLGNQVCQKISNSLKNHFVSEETKEKIRQTQLSKHYHVKHSEETKLLLSHKLSESWKNLSKEEFKRRISILRKNVVYRPRGKYMIITNGTDIRFVDKTLEIPFGWYRGNCKTAGKHDMSHYTEEMRQHRRDISMGKNNNMYGKGYKVAGGKNGRATKWYRFKDIVFNCRKDLFQYLKNQKIKDINENAIRNIENKTYGKRTLNKFRYVIDNLTWGYKYEDKIR